MWPVGSSGLPQNGHGGRPAATSALLRRAKARASAGVRATRIELRPSGPTSSSASSSTSSGSWSWHSMTTFCASSSQARERVCTCQSSSNGVCSGSVSSGAPPGSPGSTAATGASWSSTSLTRSARIETCCFSTPTVTTRGPVLAWREKARWPAGPTVPATNRSAGSKSWTVMRSTLSDTSGCPGAPAHDGVALLGGRLLGRSQPRQVAPDVVEPQHERLAARVAHGAHRGRVDVDPLEVVEVGAGGVRQDRLDDVTVRHRDPDRVLAVRLEDACIDLPHRAQRPVLHLHHGLGGVCRRVGEARLARSVLHDLPELLLGELRDGSPSPRAVAALPQSLVDAAGHVVRERGGQQVGGLHAPVER